MLVGVSIIILTGHCLSAHGCELGPAALCHSWLVCPALLVEALLWSLGGSPLALLLLHLWESQRQVGQDLLASPVIESERMFNSMDNISREHQHTIVMTAQACLSSALWASGGTNLHSMETVGVYLLHHFQGGHADCSTGDDLYALLPPLT